MLSTEAQMRRKIRLIANHTPKRIREMMKPGPVTITKGDGSVTVVEAVVLPAMSKPAALAAPKFWTRERLAADAIEQPKSDEGLLPAEGYAEIVNELAKAA